MKTKYLLFPILIFAVILGISAKKKPEKFENYTYGTNKETTEFLLKFEKGKEHNHPLFAVWLGDENGNYIQTLYVSESVGKGVFKHVSKKTGHWQAGEIQRPATLPYWTHQRNVVNEFGTYLPTPKMPVADAYTGATPQASFVLNLFTDRKLSGKYKIFVELNQSWDWNEFWTNDKFLGDKEYKTSSQPALIYSADFDTDNKNQEIELKTIGRSHYSGADGKMYSDLNTITTALKIAKKITVVVK
jgi:hypothetical protein